MTSAIVATQETGLLLIHAQTALHPGSGTALGAVDLPVQRERHTQWPTIAGSALKGILRDSCREEARHSYGGDRKKANEEDPDLIAAFGPGKVDESSSHAGALSVTDARILAFPVRSLRGVFAWVTCMDVLQRLQRDLGLAKMDGMTLPEEPGKEKALCAGASDLLVGGDKLVLKSLSFSVRVTRAAWPNGLASVCPTNSPGNGCGRTWRFYTTTISPISSATPPR